MDKTAQIGIGLLVVYGIVLISLIAAYPTTSLLAFICIANKEI